jgi:hypothetical protein
MPPSQGVEARIGGRRPTYNGSLGGGQSLSVALRYPGQRAIRFEAVWQAGARHGVALETA